LYEQYRGKPFFNDLTNFVASDLVMALEVLTENCISKVKDFVSAIRGQFGTDQIKSAIYGSESAAGAAKEL
jgi:nucleoside-diphosphate kinase